MGNRSETRFSVERKRTRLTGNNSLYGPVTSGVFLETKSFVRVLEDMYIFILCRISEMTCLCNHFEDKL
jgi:hypothetical protein